MAGNVGGLLWKRPEAPRSARGWPRQVLVHGLPLLVAVMVTALITSALVTSPARGSLKNLGLNDRWAPVAYSGSLSDNLAQFIEPIRRLFAIRISPPASWTQTGVGEDDAAHVVAASYRTDSRVVEPALRAGASTTGGQGLVPWETFDTIPLTTDTSAIIDQGNGNLILKSTDAALTTFGVDLSNDRYFNSLATYAGSLGGQWSSPLSGFDTGLNVGTTNRYYVAPSGNIEMFKPDGAGGWIQPPSFNATLTTGSSSSTLVLNDSGEKLSFNSSGWVTSDVDQNGLGNTYTYDTTGQVTKVTESTGRFFALSWSNTSPSYITSITDSANRTTSYGHDASGRLTRVDSPGGYWETYTYNSAGLVSRIQGIGPSTSTQVQTDITYDASDRVLSLSQGTVGVSGYARTTTYSGWGASGTVSVTDGNGNVTLRGISASNVPISTTDPLGRKSSWTHNANGDVVTYTGPGATSPLKLTYNLNNSLTNTTAPTGASSSATYGTSAGCAGTGGTAYDPHCTTDPAGNTTALTYDSSGNLLKSADTTANGTGATTAAYTYATASGGCYTTTDGGVTVVHGLVGQLCSSKSANGAVTTYEYDTAGNRTAIIAPAPLGRSTATYDSLGRMTSSTDGNGKTTNYGYNVRDNVVSTTYAGGSVLTAGFTPNGLQASGTVDSNNKDAFTYDVLGQLLTENDRHGSVSRILTYAYDGAGNLTSYTDPYGTVTYSYDSANQLVALIEPNGSCVTGAPAASSGCIKFGYDQLGQETSRTFPGGAAVVTTRDASGRPTRITAKDSAGSVVYDKAYDYSLSGTDTLDVQKTTSYVEAGVAAGATTTYAYDTLDRLSTATEAAGGSARASWAYTYDADGNRTKQVLTGAIGTAAGAPTAGTTTYAYNAADQLTSTSADTSTWTYDADGQLLRNGITGVATGYNDRQGVASSAAASYVTFAAGNNPTYNRTDGASSTIYTNSSKLGLMGEDYGNQRIYDRTPDGDAVGSRLSQGSRYYFVQDLLGSVVGLFSKDGAYYGGYTYGPSGEARFAGTDTALTNNHLRYISGYFDESTGLYKFGARYYDSSTGRFTQMDPSGQEQNAYLYAQANPISNVDLTGLLSHKVSFGTLNYTITYYLWGETIRFTKKTTKLMSRHMGKVGAALGAVCLATGPATAVCGAVAAVLFGVYNDTIINAASDGRCFQMNLPWAAPAIWVVFAGRSVKC